MINAIINFLGEYTPLAGDGIASINPVWLLAAALMLMTVWFIYKIILTCFKGLFNV